MTEKEILDKSIEMHKKLKGKIEINNKIKINSKEILHWAYTPGVAQPCIEIANDKEKVYDYTTKANMVAIVTNGTAVLGLGTIGPEASLPVMEGKAMIFKEFGGIDAFPIAIDSYDTKKIVETVKMISPGFGGINIEDISAPECFEIETRLKEELDIPVFHDDQHGTAIVVLAGLINACKIINKRLEDLSIVINGSGAAGTAISNLLKDSGVRDVVVLDSKGALYYCRQDLIEDPSKKELARRTNYACQAKEGKEKVAEECSKCMRFGLTESLAKKDVFIGVSKGNLLSQEMIKKMNKNPIIFALANPIPEISYEDAKEAGAKIVATGRSDMPNQVNNAYAFPGIFRGALDARARTINEEMKIAAANAIARNVEEIKEDNIMPNLLDKKLHSQVADEVYKAAIESGASKIHDKSY